MAKIKTKWKIEIIVLELLLICALLGVLFVKKVESYTFNSTATFFEMGMDYTLPEGSSAKVDQKTKNITIITKNNEEYKPNGLPVYIDNNKIVLMNDMALVLPESQVAAIFRLSYFTEIELNKDLNSIRISRDTNEKTVSKGFLFDGKDSYVFLEPVVIDCGNIHQNLSAFSYVQVDKENYIIMFDYDTKEIIIENITDEVFLKDAKGRYSANISNDYLIFGNDMNMLHSYVDVYEPYFEVDTEE